MRAAAHAGAFAAARDAGVTFSRVAGTSGGSIVAALAAAGADPQYLADELKSLDFADLLTPPDPSRSVFKPPPKLWRLAKVFSSETSALIDLATFSGLHDSNRLEEKIEGWLQALIGPRRKPGERGPITFSELIIPLHVVATDLTTGKPKVWSCEETPHESVAQAVRCSCSIPFFFQPTLQGKTLLVDGGVLSNLPAFVFSQLNGTTNSRSVLSRILAFRLIEDADSAKQPYDIFTFGAALARAAIDGATYIQSQLQQNVYSVSIQTGSICSTDFDGINNDARTTLYEAGTIAVRQFIAEERLNVRNQSSAITYHGFDEKMLLLVQELMACNQCFFAVGNSTYWADFVFPTLLAAARRGVQITIITKKSDDLRERRRKWLLAKLGAKLIELEEAMPFDGFAFDLSTPKASAILGAMNAGQDVANIYELQQVRLYTLDSDPVLLQLLTEKLESHWTELSLTPRSLPYVECADTKLFKCLRTIPMYSNAKFRITDVDVGDDLFVLQHAVKEFKVLQIRNHMRDLNKNGIDFFSLTEIGLPGGQGSIVTPPVLERAGSKLVVIEGNTRLFHCLKTGVSKIRAVVVDEVQARLPAANPQPLSSLKLVSTTTTIDKLYSNVEKSLYRPIEDAAHPFLD